MKIQLITGNRNLRGNDDITISDYSYPMSPDDFDINIIDLSYSTIWRNSGYGIGPIDISVDLKPISKMVSDSTKSKIVYVYPQDGDFLNYYDGKRFVHRYRIKDLISNNRFDLGYNNCFSIYSPHLEVVFEPTKTKIGGVLYSADFRFSYDSGSVITKSENSGKTTTIKTNNKLFFTTLDICKSIEKMMVFVNEYLVDKVLEIPEWVKNFEFLNDNDVKTDIEESVSRIAELKQKIDNAECILSENNRYKSILSETGEKLVEVVFEMLEKILDCDLTAFIDINKEDFRIIKDGVVFIGEIKGINTNVKNGNISQLDVHYQNYMDENGGEQNAKVCALLIINHQRSRNLNEREPVNEQQIDLARRNGSLIVETITLLKMFEEFLKGNLTAKECEEVFANKTGILKIEDLQGYKQKKSAEIKDD